MRKPRYLELKIPDQFINMILLCVTLTCRDWPHYMLELFQHLDIDYESCTFVTGHKNLRK